MGLFSSKKKYTVNVTIQRMFEDHQIPKSTLNGVIKGVVQGDDMVSNIKQELSESMGVRVNNATGWLKRKTDYGIGIPTSHTTTYIKAKPAVIEAIQANIGKTITPEYYYMGPLNSMHFGWSYCFNALAYDAATNELKKLSADTGFKCYLKNMIATYTREDYNFMQETNDMGMVQQMGPSPSSGFIPSKPMNVLGMMGQYAAQPAYEVSDVALDDYVTIEYEFKDANGTFVTRGITVSMAGMDTLADYHMCRYKDASGVTGFFTYAQGTGTYPSIDRAYLLEYNGLGTYVPWVYFRRNSESIIFNESQRTVEHTKAFCSKLGVHWQTIYDGVMKDPNLGDVAQALLVFGVAPNATDPSELEYLFKHFSALHDNSLAQSQLAQTLNEKLQAFTSSPSQLQRIMDNRFSMDLQYSGIQRQRVPGTIGKVGTYTGHYGVVSQDSQQFLTQGPTGVGKATATNSQPAWIYRRQILESTYEEVAIYGLRQDYKVHQKKGFAAGADSDKLLIPCDNAILKTIGLPVREQLLCRALRMMVNTVIITETPWYASSGFKIIMIIVAVIITIFSLGSAWQTIVAAAGLGATALVITILTMIVTSLAISYGVKLFVKKFGPQIGLLAAVAAMVYGAYTVNASGGESAWGSAMLSVGNNLVAESNSAYKSALQDAYTELDAMQQYAAGQMESLKEQRDKLGLNPQFAGLDGLDLVKLAPGIVIGEAPGNLYLRTIHSGNIGALSFDMTETFVDNALQLPKLSDVNGDFEDGSIPAD